MISAKIHAKINTLDICSFLYHKPSQKMICIHHKGPCYTAPVWVFFVQISLRVIKIKKQVFEMVNNICIYLCVIMLLEITHTNSTHLMSTSFNPTQDTCSTLQWPYQLCTLPVKPGESGKLLFSSSMQKQILTHYSWPWDIWVPKSPTSTGNGPCVHRL